MLIGFLNTKLAANAVFMRKEAYLSMPLSYSVLITTQNTRTSFFKRALPSITLQSIRPKYVIIVNDGTPFTSQEKEKLKLILSSFEYVVLFNSFTTGAAGAWNSGIQYLYNKNFNGYVAILDDDDEWHENHIQLNLKQANDYNADVVISGLKMVQKDKLLPRCLPLNLKPQDFLTGNPGWQGSNTFVSMKTLKKVKGFRNGLLSTNDRDLAFRILSLPNIKVAYTNQWTASWHHDVDNNSLSLPKSKSKVQGLQWFWYLYQRFFTAEQRKDFFDRANCYFEISKEEIISIGENKPINTTLYGDLNV